MKLFYTYLYHLFTGNSLSLSLFTKNHLRIFFEWKKQLDSGLWPMDLELPWITIISKDYLKKYLSRNKEKGLKVLEYGSGGSSLFFLKYANEVVSVEHDSKWFESVLIKVKDFNQWNGNLILPEPIDSSDKRLSAIEPTDYYTADVNFKKSTFRNYASYIDMFPNDYFDVVLVDGRSRPACIYHARHKVKKGGLLVVDNAERSRYEYQSSLVKDNFKLDLYDYGALICTRSFTQTNIYVKVNSKK